MKRVRLIALDMDGTLLASDHHTLPSHDNCLHFICTYLFCRLALEA